MTEARRYGVQPGNPDGVTPSQTVGPFFAYVLTPHEYGTREIFSKDIVTPDAVGHPIRIEGYVIDGDGEPIIDAMLEIWQADGDGRYAGAAPQHGANTAFKGFGRSDVDSNGFFAFRTVKPGQVPGPDGTTQAPHINVGVFARGLLKRLFTRIYFQGEPANATDPILALVPKERRHTLIAARRSRGDDTVYTFNIRLQGEDETVFFEA
ncbi:protocatechuate 3,4-dioxygenase subunit alpha [Enterovirga aerilata]|uniref:Protocatechuate 3,4-dioxygenase subunit alpha n=1 Tax=Enterovirga aerilata TaxID=2730920 RepID=A0A849I8D0_9HYPH|nr:protocatechuate 3,4-dioxygenase subunit alpha [Enterovirga sp. DB1703]NNM72320.1 protocatechuate 3,4-dioxygenase subunit alpha [Enterovirga sp. DB1703]